jgi:hypothetical protein
MQSLRDGHFARQSRLGRVLRPRRLPPGTYKSPRFDEWSRKYSMFEVSQYEHPLTPSVIAASRDFELQKLRSVYQMLAKRGQPTFKRGTSGRRPLQSAAKIATGPFKYESGDENNSSERSIPLLAYEGIGTVDRRLPPAIHNLAADFADGIVRVWKQRCPCDALIQSSTIAFALACKPVKKSVH